MPVTLPSDVAEQLLNVDPRSLRYGPNVRVDMDIDDDFRQSIREHGVLEVITCYRDPDTNELIVYRGNRRAWCAAELVDEDGDHLTWSTVPVRVIDRPDDPDRIVTQLTENRHRTATAIADEAAAVAQLAAFGIAPADIARRVSVPQQHVARYAQVAKTPAAAQIADTYDLTIDQAAGIAEFDTDPKTVELLRDAAERGQFDHELERARRRRDDDDEVARITAELRKQKIKVVKDSREVTGYGTTALALDALGLTPDGHKTCPGHCAWVGLHSAYVDGTWQHIIAAVYYCRDYKANGHKKPRQQPTTGAAEKTDEQREKESAERRLVIAGNKAWDAAEAVRRRWLQQQAQVTKPHPEAPVFIATLLLRHGDLTATAASGDSLWRRFRDVMGLDGDVDATHVQRRAELDGLADRIGTMRAGRVTHLTALALMCAWDDTSGRNSWRNGSDPRTKLVLTTMQAWGYPLSPVERRAAGLEVADAEILGEPVDTGEVDD